MKLESVKLKNFRGYRTETIIPILDLTAFIGKNESGKSTILEALEIFFNSNLVTCEKADLNIDADNTNIEITCVFSAFPDEIIIDTDNPTTLQNEYLLNPENRLEIKKVFSATTAKPKEKIFIVCNHPSIENGNDLLILKRAELRQRADSLQLSQDNYNGNVNSSMREAIWNSLGELNLQETELLVDKEDTKKVYEALKKYLPIYALFQSDRQSKDDDKEVTDPMKIAVQQALSELTAEIEHIKREVKNKALDTANRTLAKLKEMSPELANKLIQKDNAVNVHYLEPLFSSLMGTDYLNERRTLVGGGRKVKTPDGKTGVQIVNPKELMAIKEWQKGNYSDAENILAEQWRNFIKSINLEELKKQWKNIKKIFPVCSDLHTVSRISENWLSIKEMQTKLLINIINEMQIEQEYSTQIFHRWEGYNNKSLKEFAPYAFFCSKVELCFNLGLVYELVRPRATNRIDSEYYYYLPFCNIFSSRDNFHKDFTSIVISDDQTFVDGDVLKADLKSIIDKLEENDSEIEIDWDSQFYLEPPDDPECFTYQMWRKYLPSWSPGWFYKKKTGPQKNEEISIELKEKIRSYELEEVYPFEQMKDKDVDFISIEYQITKNDQCPCGSGKKFGECHYRDGMESET